MTQAEKHFCFSAQRQNLSRLLLAVKKLRAGTGHVDPSKPIPAGSQLEIRDDMVGTADSENFKPSVGVVPQHKLRVNAGFSKVSPSGPCSASCHLE
jgi:hypothetical protein